jgi:hypothetical protein
MSFSARLFVSPGGGSREMELLKRSEERMTRSENVQADAGRRFWTFPQQCSKKSKILQSTEDADIKPGGQKRRKTVVETWDGSVQQY